MSHEYSRLITHDSRLIMLDLYEELRNLIAAFEADKVEYALCGGLALTVYGIVRATVDIDIMAPSDQLDGVKKIAKEQGFIIEGMIMRMKGGEVIIHRLSKLGPDEKDILSLDIIEVNETVKEIWETRISADLEKTPLKVVSKKGLIRLKKLRGSGQDLEDIKNLEKVE